MFTTFAFPEVRGVALSLSKGSSGGLEPHIGVLWVYARYPSF